MMPSGPPSCGSDAILLSLSVAGLECSYGKDFHNKKEIVARRDLTNRASPVYSAHVKP